MLGGSVPSGVHSNTPSNGGRWDSLHKLEHTRSHQTVRTHSFTVVIIIIIINFLQSPATPLCVSVLSLDTDSRSLWSQLTYILLSPWSLAGWLSRVHRLGTVISLTRSSVSLLVNGKGWKGTTPVLER